MKLWQKDKAALQEIEKFTVGRDKEFDTLLAPFDVQASIAHATMLETVGLLNKDERDQLIRELRNIYRSIQDGTFKIHAEAEDVHSHIEWVLTQKLGDTGKKIHSARSRNDQVLVAIKLYLRHELHGIVSNIEALFELLQAQSDKHKNDLLPGYTHLQLAMPSSFGLWFGAYAESLVDDLVSIKAAYDMVNKNPLGSAAGYGSSFPINRTLTTELLGFSSLHYNVVYAQMTRGKTERIVAQSFANIADTLSRLSMDACLFLNQNFGFISFPDELTTGSSIMPHKKNPDVFELIRSHCNRIKALPNEIMMMTTNLPSGYHRDLQLLKEHLFPAIEILNNCLEMAIFMLSNISVSKDLLHDEKYKYLFSVEEVNKLVLQGMPFRDAYKNVGLSIESGEFKYSTDIQHRHEGSIGNLNNDKIALHFKTIKESFPFSDVENAVASLVSG